MDQRLAAYLATVGVSEDAMAGWTIAEAFRDGASVGFIIRAGAEIHIVPMVAGKSLSRRNIIDAVQPVLDSYGYVVTRVPVEQQDHRLRERLGFKQTHQDQRYTYWALTKLPYERRTTCETQSTQGE